MLTTPPAHEWTNGFKGERAKGAFGQKEGFEDLIRTPWTTADIYLSRTFEVTSVPATARLVIHYDNATKVWINGKLVWESPAGAWNDGYQACELNAAARAALKTGTNTIVVHCHQDSGGQFIDLALLGR
jgi:beta-galactosidase